MGGRRGWGEGGGEELDAGQLSRSQAPAASHWLFFFFLQMYFKMYGILSQALLLLPSDSDGARGVFL